jgi:hypothetical protein
MFTLHSQHIELHGYLARSPGSSGFRANKTQQIFPNAKLAQVKLDEQFADGKAMVRTTIHAISMAMTLRNREMERRKERSNQGKEPDRSWSYFLLTVPRSKGVFVSFVSFWTVSKVRVSPTLARSLYIRFFGGLPPRGYSIAARVPC